MIGKFAFQIIFLLLLSSCQTIVSVSMSDMDVKKGVEIEAFDSRHGLLNLLTPRFHLNEMLAKKCPGGSVSGVQTSLLKREFVLFQIYDIQASASCQNPVTTR